MSDDPRRGTSGNGDGGSEVREAELRLAEAELKLTRLMQRLHALRRAAAVGFFDQVEMDRTSAACRSADRDVRVARAAWARARAGMGRTQTGTPAPPSGWAPDDLAAPAASAAPAAPAAQPPRAVAAPPPAATFAPTPYMRFMKWLVETGRVSDELRDPPPEE